MALLDVGGTITGTGTASASAAMSFGPSAGASGSGAASTGLLLGADLDETLTGSGGASATPEYVYLLSGNVQGQGTLIDDTLGLLAGTASGTSVVSGGLIRSVLVSGYLQGSGSAAFSVPLPIYGIATGAAFMEVTCVPPPLICTCSEITTFRYGQSFGKNLSIRLTDFVCNPIGPVWIEYTLYQVVRGCQLKQVGCHSQRPATCKVGTYYATGCAGEGGQPGQWVIRWRYQRTFADPIIEKDMCYQVLDAVRGPVPGDTTVRNCKYGWD